MSQAGYTPISLYFSTTAAAVPTSGNLVAGELAINTLDGKLYYKNSAGTVALLASTSGASGDVVGPASSTDNALARFDLATGKLIQNSVGILSDAGILTGLTGITSSGSITFSSLTSGRVTLAGASGLLTDSANLTFSGTILTSTGFAGPINGTVGATTANTGAFTTLSATGVTTVQAGSAAAPAITTTGDTNTGIFFPAADTIAFTEGGAESMRIDSSGNVGIGTSSPQARVHVYGSEANSTVGSGVAAALEINNGDTSSYGLLSELIFSSGTGGGTNRTAAISSAFTSGGPPPLNGNLRFSTRNAGSMATRMIITESGDVGIGTTSPSTKLQLTGSSQAATTLTMLYSAIQAGSIGITSGGAMAFGLDGSTGGTERMRIDTSGNVGIGTTSPSSYSAKLAVVSAGADTRIAVVDDTTNARGGYLRSNFSDAVILGTTSGVRDLVFSPDNSERMRINTTGNVGIGTNVQAGNTLRYLDLQNSDTGASAGAIFRLITSNAAASGTTSVDIIKYKTGGFYINNNDTNAAVFTAFFVGASERMRIDSSGNVGIGQAANLTSKLTVKNSITFDRYGDATEGLTLSTNSGNAVYNTFGGENHVFQTAGTERVRFDTSGNVGIGTSSPGAKLQVITPSSGDGVIFRYTSGTNNPGLFFSVNESTTVSQINASGSTSGILAFATSNAERARIDSSGNLLVGTTTATGLLTVVGGTTGGTSVQAGFGGTNATSFRIFHADVGGSNAALCVAKIEAVTSTSRSINAAGTVNASGADYAEYMTKAGDFVVAKGDVVGINAQGKLTNVFADAVSFVVKSTNPSYVGGDTWGNEDAIGLRPEKPKQFAAKENTEAETDEAFAIRYAQYESDKATFDATLEAARSLVDRIAFAGQVPVNVIGATSGQYIIPTNDSGAIKGQAVTSPSFEQYQQAVGKVIAIESDGRARIIVKVA